MRAADGTAFDINGPADAPPVVLIHGLGLHRGMWADYVTALAADYHVLSYDLYGHGESALPPAKPSLTIYSEQLARLMDAVGMARAAIVGFSLGGMINRRFAMDHGARASGLAIIASPHERGEAGQAELEQRARDSVDGPAATLDAAIERWFTPDFRAANGDYIAQVRADILRNDPKVFGECRWVLAHGVRELVRPRPPITHKTLVMTAEHDSGSSPAMTHAIASEIEGARAVVIPELQHMGVVERPDLFLPPLQSFLKELT
ncbi:MAG: alpha/beta fold hydrolase [Pikeienuella sp.]